MVLFLNHCWITALLGGFVIIYPVYDKFTRSNRKSGKDGYDKSVGYIPPKGWISHNILIYPVFLEFVDQMENLGKDDTWELSVLATCGWIRRNYPVFLEFIEKKWNIGLKIGYSNLGSIPFGWWILRFTLFFCQIHWKKWKFGVKIAYENFEYNSLVTWMVRIYPVFFEFTDQMENRGKDDIWELNVLATCGWIRRINPVSLEFIEKNGKSGRRLDMVTWDPFHLEDKFSRLNKAKRYVTYMNYENRTKLPPPPEILLFLVPYIELSKWTIKLQKITK